MSFKKFVLIPFSDYNQTDKSAEHSEVKNIFEYADFISPKLKIKGRQLLSLLQKFFVSAAETGEVVLQNRIISKTNFLDFFKYLMNKSPKESNVPTGINEILTYLRDLNFPGSSIANPHARTRLLDASTDGLDKDSLPANAATGTESLQDQPEKSNTSLEKANAKEEKTRKKTKHKSSKAVWLKYT